MRAVVQRVKSASVSVNGKIEGSIEKGLLILFCAEGGDTDDDFEYTKKKCLNMRIFEDSDGKMNLSVADVGGEILCVSQFTLAAEIKRGNRPGFTRAMEPEAAKEVYERFCAECGAKKGVFGADMQVNLINDGPVTIIVDSRNRI